MNLHNMPEQQKASRANIARRSEMRNAIRALRVAARPDDDSLLIAAEEEAEFRRMNPHCFFRPLPQPTKQHNEAGG